MLTWPEFERAEPELAEAGRGASRVRWGAAVRAAERRLPLDEDHRLRRLRAQAHRLAGGRLTAAAGPARAAELVAILDGEPWFRDVLAVVAAVDPPDWWVG